MNGGAKTLLLSSCNAVTHEVQSTESNYHAMSISLHLLRGNHVTIAVIAMGVSFHMMSGSLICYKDIYGMMCVQPLCVTAEPPRI